MNSNRPPVMKKYSIVALLTLAFVGRATIPEPDNIIYGNISLDGSLVTAARTDVVIEARRTTNGPAIATYRMGSEPALGNFYSLRLLLESVTPVANTNASQVSQSVFISVADGGGSRAQSPFTITERGAVQRIDFGVAAVDSDGDGLPDAWELQRYANLNPSPASLAPNGMTALQNFIAGTDPNDLNGGFWLRIGLTNNQRQVTFVAVKAEGPGYDGMTRRYTLESNSSFAAASWTNVIGYVDLPGDNQPVSYVTSAAGAPGFFRGKVSLQGFTVPGADSDADGLPDAWETLHFGSLSENASTLSPNKQTAMQNFVAGTNPNDTNSLFKLKIARNNNQPWVSFLAMRAEGAGYEGRNRYYSLETSSDPAAVTWQGVAGWTNLLGDNQTLNYLSPSTVDTFYRARVWLQPQ